MKHAIRELLLVAQYREEKPPEEPVPDDPFFKDPARVAWRHSVIEQRRKARYN